jgi:uncharacterized membrane protein (UPF0182 family)
MSNRAIGFEKRRGPGPLIIVITLFVLLFVGRYAAGTLLDYEWWKEIHQLDTWISQLLYGTLPILIAAIFLFACFAVAWRLGSRRGSTRGVAASGQVSRLILIGLAVVSLLLATIIIDPWNIVRFFGGLRIPGAGNNYVDPIFGLPLRFYFFYLPFFQVLLHVLLTAGLVSLLLYWLAAHFQDLGQTFARYSSGGFAIEREGLGFGGAFDSTFARLAAAVLLIALAIQFYFARYDLLFDDHGAYLLGVNYVADHIVLPLQWLLIACAVLAAGLVLGRKGKLALLLLLVLPVRYIVPPLVQSVYVRPNELALERPYIAHHIQATRSAYGLAGRMKETRLDAKPEIAIDYAKHKSLLENVRLWDWKAFHDTVSQIQPLRPYAYFDTDIDRYQISGSLRQVLLTPRELDIQQLGDARSRWINPHLIYTHGYGIVMAGANSITPDGLPQLMIEDAPPRVNVPDLRVERPELYYGEIDQEPVYVSTDQPEFDYPGSEDTGHTNYHGSGGFSASSFLVRLAAAIKYGDVNILLTKYLNSTSKMMIHRRITDRLSTQAGFLSWDGDPYLVLNSKGRLVWIVDGYMASASHPYSREVYLPGIGTVNYLRNSVKATVDAYSGETHLYVFDPADPLIQAYWKLFPHLLEPASAMPADLRAHVRYPETLFATQAEIYRAFHMRNPQDFYNRADLWDIAKTSTAATREADQVKPTYVMATLPGDGKLEFLLIMPFTPANKDNLIGMMVARCDGEHLGELVFQQLDKRNIIYGPKQIESFINQDQTISKDLTLWNQQSSEVLRGQILVLPIENSFLYVEPIYIQASGARMPQLKKVALAMGDHLAYADTYQQALALLMGQNTETQETSAATSETSGPIPQPVIAAAAAEAARKEDVLRQIRDHFQKYKDLNSQGKYSEAGKELETVQKLLNQK